MRQDASDATAWLGRIRDLRHDPVEDRLLGVDIYDQRIVEFTIDGAFAGSFGRYGEGPGELRKVAAFEVTGRHAVVLDDTLVAVMPGPEGTLYERIGVDGRISGAFGDGGYVGISCLQCSITNIGDGLLVVMKPALPEGRIYRLDGTLFDALGFGEIDHVLSQWRLDFQETVRRASGMVAAGGGGRIAAGRLWAGTNTGALRNGSFFASAIPENMGVNPVEFWVLDRHGRVRQRYVF